MRLFFSHGNASDVLRLAIVGVIDTLAIRIFRVHMSGLWSRDIVFNMPTCCIPP